MAHPFWQDKTSLLQGEDVQLKVHSREGITISPSSKPIVFCAEGKDWTRLVCLLLLKLGIHTADFITGWDPFFPPNSFLIAFKSCTLFFLSPPLYVNKFEGMLEQWESNNLNKSYIYITWIADTWYYCQNNCLCHQL